MADTVENNLLPMGAACRKTLSPPRLLDSSQRAKVQHLHTADMKLLLPRRAETTQLRCSEGKKQSTLLSPPISSRADDQRGTEDSRGPDVGDVTECICEGDTGPSASADQTRPEESHQATLHIFNQT
ncbi:unnamed protein product [Pleuronectes platessa]|uniref:Uncharacterized protein n=1 Tax=Pleuronectes platessa TaxID=8262 RepID=A0A9N7VRP6_PLEPL|nr:unnamed protein product [Pleuronectes platessa]